MGDIETVAGMPQIPSAIPSGLDVSSTKSLEDIGARSCPLCRSEVRLFFINFNEKILMCENTKCEFPFGYEELVFVKEDEDSQSHVELGTQSLRSKATQETPSCSVMSAACWSEIEKLNRVYDSEDSQVFEAKALEPKEYMSLNHVKQNKEPLEECNISTRLKEIKELTMKLEEKKPNVIIKNETYLKNLMELPGKPRSNTQVLKPEEIKLVKKETVPATSTVKLDIKAEGGMSIININVIEEKQPNNSENGTIAAGENPV